ncbi:hypothetical protein RC86_04810 [Pectobacterium brasiliense]|nr:hypothetical protein RC86_04810 [Pectobacterium brasiliense]
MSKTVSSQYKNNSTVQNNFLDQIAAASGKDKQVTVVTDAQAFVATGFTTFARWADILSDVSEVASTFTFR